MSLTAIERKVLSNLTDRNLPVILRLKEQGLVTRQFAVTDLAKRALMEGELGDRIEKARKLLNVPECTMQKDWRVALQELMVARGIDDQLKSTRWQLTDKGRVALEGKEG